MADFPRVLGNCMIIMGAGLCAGLVLVVYGIVKTVRNRRKG